MKPNEFEEMHAAMARFCERCNRDGWPSAEVERHAHRVRRYLWELANNDVPSPSAIRGLAAETEALANAQRASQ